MFRNGGQGMHFSESFRKCLFNLKKEKDIGRFTWLLRVEEYIKGAFAII